MTVISFRISGSMKKSLSAFFLVIALCLTGECRAVMAGSYAGEKIIYGITPFGRAEYNDLGQVDMDGQRVNCVTFRTQAMGFDDTETIYSDPQSHLPLKVERDISDWLGHEYLVEIYDQTSFKLTIDKFTAKGKRKVKTYRFESDGTIYNAILLPFYLRQVKDLDIGWEMKVRLPDEFTVRLDAEVEVRIPAGKFMTYHFVSVPHKFEVWVTKDALRLPIRIKGLGGVTYTMVMKKHSLPDTAAEGIK